MGGLYTCTVANNKPSDEMAAFTVKGNTVAAKSSLL